MRMSRRPNPSTAAAIRRSAPSGSRRSASTAMTRSAASSRAAASARAWVRELTTTNAPLAARRRATASPMPADDPVTTATLSSRASAASAANAGMPASDGIRQRGRVLQRGHRAGHHGAVHAADHLAVLDAGGLVVAGQEPVRGLEGLLHGGLLLDHRDGEVARHRRLLDADLAPRVDELVVDVVHDVAADAGDT